MESRTNAPPLKQWLIQGDDVASGSVLDAVKGDPEISRIERIAPDIVLLTMSADRAGRLQSQFGNRLVMEQNQKLTPPSPG